MKKILLILFINLFTQPCWSNDYRGVENCKDIIFNSPELKVKVSDNDDLGWVSIFNRTDIKDIEFKNIYIDYKKKIEFEQKEYDELYKYVEDKPIELFASVWDKPSVDFILSYSILSKDR